MKQKTSIAGVAILIGLIITAIMIPVVMQLVSKNADNRNRAAINYCGWDNQQSKPIPCKPIIKPTTKPTERPRKGENCLQGFKCSPNEVCLSNGVCKSMSK